MHIYPDKLFGDSLSKTVIIGKVTFHTICCKHVPTKFGAFFVFAIMCSRS